MIDPKYYPPRFDMYRYSHITPTANEWAGNLNNRWDMIALIKKGESSRVIEHLINFYKEKPGIEPSISDEEKASYVDYDFSCWSRAASPLIVADSLYISNAISSIREDCLETSPLTKAVHDKYNLSHLYDYVSLDLKAPDEIIIKSIKQYIAYARSELKIEGMEKRISVARINGWKRCLLLPYLDLKIWLEASGLTLKKTDELFGEDLDRRTDYLETLTAQGIYELEEKRAVHELLRKGMSARKIADRLKITVKSVNMHKKT